MTSSQDDKLYPAQPDNPRPYLQAETLGAWRQHPISRLVLEFIRDRRIQQAECIAETVFNGGKVTPEYLHDVSIACGVMREIETLEAEDINDFYGIEPPTAKEEKTDGE